MAQIILSGQAVRKAGANVSTSIPEVAYTEWISGATAFINVNSRKNFSDDFTGLNDDVKHIVADTLSDLVAIKIVTYDMSSVGVNEAADRINIFRDNALRNIKELTDDKQKTFITNA